MQVVILGATGTCKKAVAQELAKKDGFQLEPQPTPESPSAQVGLKEQMWLLCERFRLARELTKKQEENDFLTIRAFWDAEVYVAAGRETRVLTADEADALMEAYRTMLRAVEPPHGVIFLHATELQTDARQALKGQLRPDEEFEAVVRRLYREHVRRIGLSVAEVAVSEQFEVMMDEVRGAMNSFRSSNIGAPSIWKRSYFR